MVVINKNSRFTFFSGKNYIFWYFHVIWGQKSRFKKITNRLSNFLVKIFSKFSIFFNHSIVSWIFYFLHVQSIFSVENSKTYRKIGENTNFGKNFEKNFWIFFFEILKMPENIFFNLIKICAVAWLFFIILNLINC